MTEQDIKPQDFSKLASMLMGGRVAVKTDPNAPIVDIKIDGIPLEVSIPAIVNILAEFMQYSIDLVNEQQKPREEEQDEHTVCTISEGREESG